MNLSHITAPDNICDSGALEREARDNTPTPWIQDAMEAALPDGWWGDGDTLVCPCGYDIELDGRCPDGCVSPLVTQGMI